MVTEEECPADGSQFCGIEWPDYLVIVAYFVSVLLVGLYVSIKDKHRLLIVNLF